MKRHHLRRHHVICLAALIVSIVSSTGPAQQAVAARIFRALTPGGTVPLPYSVADATGNQWMVYQVGYLQMQGNSPLYSQGATIQINGNQPNARANTARLDDKTGEILFENLNCAGFQLTRRIFIDKENSYARYIDLIKNTQPQEQIANVQIVSNLNFGIDAAQTITDPRKKDSTIGWSATNGNGRSVVEMFAGKGAKISPTINFQQGNTTVQGIMQVPIPAGQEVAVMHLHGVVGTPEQGVQFVQQLREGKLMASIPIELRKKIVNFVTGQGFIGERELLRGELFDVVEIRGGDQMRGTLKEPSYKLSTFYGDVELPAARVVGLINVGEFRPRQLVVTTDGEIFGGKLARDTLNLELTSGQVTQIPLSQVTRVGYRKRTDEPEEWSFDKPFVSLRSGDRIGIQMPETPIEIVTRYGALKLDPKSVAAIVFQTEEHGVHDIHLTDGSKFAGLVAAPQFEMKLSGGGTTTQPSEQPPQIVRFPSSAISRIQFAQASEIDDAESPTMTLANQDMLVGALAGSLKLDTAFDTLTIDAGQVRKLSRGKEGASDVQVTLWDSSIVSGQLQDPSINCKLASGVEVSIPVALVEEYNQPRPQPAAGMVEKIKASVAQLNADDWKARDRAEAELTTMGSVVVAVLKDMRANQPPEAQQRIDQIIASVSKKK
jgi:hypothetical protein